MRIIFIFEDAVAWAIIPTRRCIESVMLNHAKSVGYDCSLFPWLVSFVLLGKSTSFGAVFRTLILWR
ncbi:TPA: hypothetical protein I7719_11975 [Vibrio vulnificus]|nr:hypothetical protein [Vibrio vulnificus]